MYVYISLSIYICIYISIKELFWQDNRSTCPGGAPRVGKKSSAPHRPVVVVVVVVVVEVVVVVLSMCQC